MNAERRDLESLIRGARGDAAQTPPFERVWSAVVERQRRRRPRRRLALAAVTLTAAILLVVLLVPAPDSWGPAPRSSDAAPSEAYELARSLSAWQAPLDFLLEPPGGGLLGVDPRAGDLRLLDALPTLDPEEIL